MSICIALSLIMMIESSMCRVAECEDRNVWMRLRRRSDFGQGPEDCSMR